MKRLSVLTMLTALLALWTMTVLAVPAKINYQGQLKDGSGNIVPDNVYTLAFKIYDAASGGSVLWSETLPVQVTGGLFTVILGNSTVLDATVITPRAARYLGVTVNLDPEVSPRTELVSVAYAIQADEAALAQDLTCAGCVGASDIDETQVQRRVTGTAPPGEYITGINPDGSVVTGSDAGASAWNLTGNSGTTPGTNFLGTTDNQALELKVNGLRALRLEPTGFGPNVIGGAQH